MSDGKEKRRFRWKRAVEFSECDPAGVAHFTTLLKLAEAAEHAWWRELGLAGEFFDLEKHAWPRVAVTGEFLGPVQFGDLVGVTIEVAKLGGSSIGYRAVLEMDRGEKVAVVEWTVVYVKIAEQQASGLPDRVREAFE